LGQKTPTRPTHEGLLAEDEIRIVNARYLYRRRLEAGVS
jgi:hypothetical protein